MLQRSCGEAAGLLFSVLFRPHAGQPQGKRGGFSYPLRIKGSAFQLLFPVTRGLKQRVLFPVDGAKNAVDESSQPLPESAPGQTDQLAYRGPGGDAVHEENFVGAEPEHHADLCRQRLRLFQPSGKRGVQHRVPTQHAVRQLGKKRRIPAVQRTGGSAARKHHRQGRGVFRMAEELIQ